MATVYRLDRGESASGYEARLLELDGLRGVACLVILLYHVKPNVVPFGWAAVDLFFVLSGFLITSILVRHEGSPGLLKNFYARRFLRIWPLYYLTVVGVVVAGPYLAKPTSWAGLGYYLTFTQNLPLYWSGVVPPFSPYVPHLWTLANEEQFYLAWPFLVVLLGRRWVIPLAVALAGASVVARGQGFNSWLLLARADGFALGGLLAALVARGVGTGHEKARARAAFGLVTLAALGFVAVVVAKGQLPVHGRPPAGAAFAVLGINLAFFGVVGLTVTHAGRPALGWMRRPWLVRVGTLSYGLYVYHYLVLFIAGDFLLRARGRGRTPLIDVALLALTYLMAVASWEWFEKPILGLKRHFGYGPRRATRAVEGIERAGITSGNPR